jgi:hypothetical protein
MKLNSSPAMRRMVMTNPRNARVSRQSVEQDTAEAGRVVGAARGVSIPTLTTSPIQGAALLSLQFEFAGRNE